MLQELLAKACESARRAHLPSCEGSDGCAGDHYERCVRSRAGRSGLASRIVIGYGHCISIFHGLWSDKKTVNNKPPWEELHSSSHDRLSASPPCQRRRLLQGQSNRTEQHSRAASCILEEVLQRQHAM